MADEVKPSLSREAKSAHAIDHDTPAEVGDTELLGK
jgi:hypothetical protein